MLQIYFLTVLLNIISGFILVYAIFQKDGGEIENDGLDFDDEISSVKKNFSYTSAAFLKDPTFRLVVAVISGFVGLIKLFYTTVPDDVPVLGDFFPALACLLSCVSLFTEWFENRDGYEESLPALIHTIFIGGRKIIGVFCLGAGFLHFIFPKVILL